MFSKEFQAKIDAKLQENPLQKGKDYSGSLKIKITPSKEEHLMQCCVCGVFCSEVDGACPAYYPDGRIFDGNEIENYPNVQPQAFTCYDCLD